MEAYEIAEDAAGPDHRETAALLAGIASLHLRGGDAAAAEPLFAQALGRLEKAQGMRIIRADIRSEHGACLIRLGRYAEAEKALLQARAVLTEELEDDDELRRLVEERLEKVRQAPRPSRPYLKEGSVLGRTR